MHERERATVAPVAHQGTGISTGGDTKECSASQAKTQQEVWPPCLATHRVPECILEGFLTANDIGNQDLFNTFMDGLDERWRLELMAITREACAELVARRARPTPTPVRGKGSGDGKRRSGAYWRGLMEGVPAGGRDIALTSVAGMLMRNPSVPPDQRLPLLRQFNERHCKPPVSEADIRRIAGVFRRYN